MLRYLSEKTIPDQPMFLAAIVTALRQDRIRHLHPHWTSLVTSLLPFLGKSLSQVVQEVTTELCRNMERLSSFYKQFASVKDEDDDEETVNEESYGQIPADYIVTQLGIKLLNLKHSLENEQLLTVKTCNLLVIYG